MRPSSPAWSPSCSFSCSLVSSGSVPTGGSTHSWQAVDDELEPLLERLRRAAERIDAAEARGVRGHELELSFPEIERDELTGLRNRIGYEADLEREIEVARRTGRPLSLLLLDVREGDPERDELLRELAGLLQRLTRATDTVFRRGEDELGILLPETAAEGARRFHGRLRDEVVRGELSRSGPPTLAVGLVEWRPNETDRVVRRASRGGSGPVRAAGDASPAPALLTRHKKSASLPVESVHFAEYSASGYLHRGSMPHMSESKAYEEGHGEGGSGVLVWRQAR